MIDRQDAPPMPALPRGTRRLKDVIALLGELSPGKVAKIELSGDEKLGNIRNQLYQAAVRQGTRLQVWDHEGVLYAAVDDATDAADVSVGDGA
jgi:hypothetical protein